MDFGDAFALRLDAEEPSCILCQSGWGAWGSCVVGRSGVAVACVSLVVVGVTVLAASRSRCSCRLASTPCTMSALLAAIWASPVRRLAGSVAWVMTRVSLLGGLWISADGAVAFSILSSGVGAGDHGSGTPDGV